MESGTGTPIPAPPAASTAAARQPQPPRPRRVRTLSPRWPVASPSARTTARPVPSSSTRRAACTAARIATPTSASPTTSSPRAFTARTGRPTSSIRFIPRECGVLLTLQ